MLVFYGLLYIVFYQALHAKMCFGFYAQVFNDHQRVHTTSNLSLHSLAMPHHVLATMLYCIYTFSNLQKRAWVPLST